MADRPILADAAPEEREFEASLRPRRLSEYVGQPRIKRNLAVFVEAARKRGEALTMAERPPAPDARPLDVTKARIATAESSSRPLPSSAPSPDETPPVSLTGSFPRAGRARRGRGSAS